MRQTRRYRSVMFRGLMRKSSLKSELGLFALINIKKLSVVLW
jgi:hypothetical protein